MKVAELITNLFERLNDIEPLTPYTKEYVQNLVERVEKIYSDTDVYFQVIDENDDQTLYDIDGSMTPIDHRHDIIFY